MDDLTGIYFFDNEDLPVLAACCAKEQEKYSQKTEADLLPLENFYTAEEYHRKYLDKNPGGCCHIPKKLLELQKNEKGKETDEELRERIGDLAYGKNLMQMIQEGLMTSQQNWPCRRRKRNI